MTKRLEGKNRTEAYFTSNVNEKENESLMGEATFVGGLRSPLRCHCYKALKALTSLERLNQIEQFPPKLFCLSD